MIAGKAILCAVIVASLAAYAYDCLPMTTAQQAMDCCHSMPCSTQAHKGKDCCQSMAANQVAFALPTLVHHISLHPPVAGIASPVRPSALACSGRMIAEQNESPPGFHTSISPPIRI